MFKRDDYIVGIASILIGIFIIIQSAGLKVKTSLDPAGPEALPVIVAWGMIIIGIIHLIGAWYANKALGERTSSPSIKQKIEDYKSVVAMVVISLAYAGLMEILGYLILTPLLIGSILWVVNMRDLKKICKISIAMTAILYVVFAFGLQVDFPLGFIEELL
ncbi:MAG: hypothetical protein JG781_1720 [Peptococcaceae bacterium]|jgi:divalent metal cation (Fe/Co/Zn/Cd) transporter|nr:hypothetical protein [Peptococcaceae bacterium]